MHFVTHADGIAIMSNSILWFCRHAKIKTAETKIAKLGTEIVHHDTSSYKVLWQNKLCGRRRVRPTRYAPPACSNTTSDL